MTRDAQAVLQLLQTMNDWLPTPSNRIYRESQPRARNIDKRECGRCGGAGKINHGKFDCPACQGAGRLDVDQYTEQTWSETHSHDRKMLTVNCDSCSGQGAHGNGRRCHHCNGTGHRIRTIRVTATQREPGPDIVGADAKTRLYAQGSYPELETALAQFAHEAPIFHRAIMLFVVNAEPITLRPMAQKQIELSCQWLANQMPKPIRVPAWARQNTWTRNTEIQRLRRQGLTNEAIGNRVGLTKQRIGQILKETAA